MVFRKHILAFAFGFLTLHSVTAAYHDLGYQFLYPGPDAPRVPAETSFIIRFERLTPDNITNLNSFVHVTEQAGHAVTGSCKIASDQKTILFKPDRPFKSGEVIQVSLTPETDRGVVNPISYQFTVCETTGPESSEFMPDDPVNRLSKQNSNRSPRLSTAKIMPNGVSVPSNFPEINIAINDNPDNGYIFIDNRGGNGVPWNVIFDNTGSPVWYWQVPDERRDFKVQANGWATMMIRWGYEEFGGSGQGFLALDSHYNPVKTFYASNGYYTDEHELQVLADGGYLIIGRKDEWIDMSQYVSGGQNNVLVQSTCIQEYTADDDLIFQWRAWDHYDIRDVQLSDLTGGHIYFSHMNSIDVDTDGHLIVSSRVLSEVTKINRQTGDIIWRLGGAHNQFTYINDPLQGTRNQHTARVLGNSTYSIFDNGNGHNPQVSRAVKYKLDTNKMTATLIWQFRDTPDKVSNYMGNAQQLPNGNMLINWAERWLPKLTEVRPDGSKAFEMNWADGYECYRVHRCAWNGKMDVPRLETEQHTDRLILLFNKFGDPDVDYYRIYAGNSPNPTTVYDTSRVTLKTIKNLQNGNYWFRVTAVSKGGQESGYSNEEAMYLNFREPGANLVNNGDFSAAKDGWIWELQGAGQGDWSVANGEAHAAITHGGSNEYDIQLRQNAIPLTRGTTYIFEFDAHADANRTIEAKVGQDQTPFTNYSKSTFFSIRRPVEHFTWEFEMENSSDFNARVVFNLGNSDTDVYLDNISVKQKADQWPYNGTASVIPGTIQCEEYDFGGEGFAYHDDAGRNGNPDFRPGDMVDVETASDVDNGYNVGWTEDGEWLEYTVDVQSGVYDIEFRVASEPGEALLGVVLDDRKLTEFNVPATGGWQTYATLVKSDIPISGGNGLILRLEIDGSQNMNWIRFTRTGNAVQVNAGLPGEYRLYQNIPNPFNPVTRIHYQTAGDDHVLIQVFNVLGKHIKTLVDAKQTPGQYQTVWDGTNTRGTAEASGLYIVSMQSGSFHTVRKMTLLR